MNVFSDQINHVIKCLKILYVILQKRHPFTDFEGYFNKLFLIFSEVYIKILNINTHRPKVFFNEIILF